MEQNDFLKVGTCPALDVLRCSFIVHNLRLMNIFIFEYLFIICFLIFLIMNLAKYLNIDKESLDIEQKE